MSPQAYNLANVLLGVIGSGRVQAVVPHARACDAQCCAHGVGIRLPSPLLGGAGREVACACCIACARRCGSHKCRTDAILALLVVWCALGYQLYYIWETLNLACCTWIGFNFVVAALGTHLVQSNDLRISCVSRWGCRLLTGHGTAPWWR